MNTILTLAVALSLSWYGQLPPHGEFERDWLTFLLFSGILLAASLVQARRADASQRWVPGRPLALFGGLWAVLIVGVGVQSLLLPEAAWGGRQVLTLGWLAGALASLLLGALSATETAGPSAGADGRPAWASVALGLVLAALFNAAVAWVQVLPLPALQAFLPMPPEPGRGYGALFQPNLAALLLVLGMVSCAALAEAFPGARGARMVVPVVMLFLGSGVAVTGSRIGLLMLVLTVTVVGVSALRRRRGAAAGAGSLLWLAGLAAAGFALALGVAALQGAAFTSPLARSTALSNGRAMIFANAWQLGLAFPVSGAGFGQFSYWHVELPYLPKMPGYLTHAHNLWLQFWAEAGALGVLWLLLACVALALPLWRGVAQTGIPSSTGRRWALAVLVLVLLHSMTEMPLWSAPFLLVFMFAAGLWLVPGAGAGGGWPLAPLVKAGALAGMVGLAVSVWVYTDYLKVTVLFEGHRGAPVARDEAMQRASRSTFFRPTAEFAAATTSVVTRETAPVFARTLPHLWRYVTDPRLFEWQLRTAAWQRDRVAYAHYAQRFGQLYPKEYAAYRDAIAVEKSASPWIEFPVD